MSTWNYTLNDTSSMFQFSPYADGIGLLNGWEPIFSISGVNTVGGEAGAGTSSHVSQFPGASVSLSFFGNGITLFGQANCTYNVVLDNTLQAIGTQPFNTLFAQSGLDAGLHSIKLVSQANGNSQTISFTGATIMSPAEGDITSLRIGNQNTSVISYQGSWAEHSDPQIPSRDAPSPYQQTSAFNSSASMQFTGRAIEIRGVRNWGWWNYDVILDGQRSSYNASSFWILPDAVLFYQDGLNASETHSIEIVNEGSNGFEMALNSFTSFQDTGSKSSTGTPSTSSSPSGSSSPPTSPDSGSSKSSAGKIAGAVVGALACIALVALAIFLYCRRRRQRSTEIEVQPYVSEGLDKGEETVSSPQTTHVGGSPLKGTAAYNFQSMSELRAAFPTSPTSSGPRGETYQPEEETFQPMVFRDSFLAASTTVDPLESSPPPRENVTNEKTALFDAEERRGPRPLPSPPARRSRRAETNTIRSGSTTVRSGSSDDAAVARIADAVAERLANRLENRDAWVPPPSYNNYT